jgi:tripartite-type tricarboxylate transporter receptor subunit TctC
LIVFIRETDIMTRTENAALLLAGLFALCAGQAAAQPGASYPTKPVRVIVTLAAGGSSDIVTRLFAQKLAEQLKQPFLVENRPGANSIIGAGFVAKSAPDGYTLLSANTSILTIHPSLYSKLPYDPQRDFAPIAMLVIQPTVLVAHPSVPARSIKEFMALAKAQPGKFSYATPGNGTPFHLSGELFNAQTGIGLVHVPYKGFQPATADLLSGRVQTSFATVLDVLPHVKSGKLKPLVYTGSQRHILLPDVPTTAEAGIKDAESVSFFALVAPAGTPKEIVTRLNAEVVKIKALPDVRQRLIHEFGVEPGIDSLEQFEAFLRSEVAKWAKVVKASGIKVEQ